MHHSETGRHGCLARKQGHRFSYERLRRVNQILFALELRIVLDCECLWQDFLDKRRVGEEF